MPLSGEGWDGVDWVGCVKREIEFAYCEYKRRAGYKYFNDRSNEGAAGKGYDHQLPARDGLAYGVLYQRDELKAAAERVLRTLADGGVV